MDQKDHDVCSVCNQRGTCTDATRLGSGTFGTAFKVSTNVMSVDMLSLGSKNARICFLGAQPSTGTFNHNGTLPRVFSMDDDDTDAQLDAWAKRVKKHHTTVVCKVIRTATLEDLREVAITNWVHTAGGPGPRVLAYSVMQHRREEDVFAALLCNTHPLMAGRKCGGFGDNGSDLATPSSDGVDLNRLGDTPITIMIVMEQGPPTLSSYFRANHRPKHPLSASKILRVSNAVLRAIAKLVDLGVAHGDIKEDNVLYDADTGRVMILDYGTANIMRPCRLRGSQPRPHVVPSMATMHPLQNESIRSFLADSAPLPEGWEARAHTPTLAPATGGDDDDVKELSSGLVPPTKVASEHAMFARCYRPPEGLVAGLCGVGGDGNTYGASAHMWAATSMLFSLVFRRRFGDSEDVYVQPKVPALPKRASEHTRRHSSLLHHLYDIAACTRTPLLPAWHRAIAPAASRVNPAWPDAIREAHNAPRRSKGRAPPTTPPVSMDMLRASVGTPAKALDHAACMVLCRMFQSGLKVDPVQRTTPGEWLCALRALRRHGNDTLKTTCPSPSPPAASDRPTKRRRRTSAAATHAQALSTNGPVRSEDISMQREAWQRSLRPTFVLQTLPKNRDTRSSNGRFGTKHWKNRTTPTNMLLKPHYVTVMMRAVLLDGLFAIFARVSVLQERNFSAPTKGHLSLNTFVNAVTFMDRVFPLKSDAHGNAVWRDMSQRTKPNGGPNRPLSLRERAGTVSKPDRSAPELKDAEFHLLLELCVHMALAMENDSMYWDFAITCMLANGKLARAWHKGSLRRDMVIRAAPFMATAMSTPHCKVQCSNAASPVAGGTKPVTCECGDVKRIPFHFQASRPTAHTHLSPDASTLGAARMGERVRRQAPSTWKFAYMALLAIDPSFNLRGVSLPCIRCHAAFETPDLKTLHACLVRVTPRSIENIMKTLACVCCWAKRGISINIATQDASRVA